MIIFQQGAPKSASSFCSQILREIAEQNGYDQSETRAVLGRRHRGGFVAQIGAIKARLEKLPKYSVIKTHGQPFGAEHLLRENQAIAFVTFRDPLDSVRSLLDHADAWRGKKRSEFSEVNSSEDAGRIILLHLGYSLMWLRNPNVYPVYYNDLRANPKTVAAMMAEKIGLKVDADCIAKKFANKENIRRFNVGEQGRGASLLSGDEQEQLKRMFGIFYNYHSWINDHSEYKQAP